MTAQPVSQALESSQPVPGTSEAICIINPEGVIQFATPALADLYHCTRETLVGCTVTHFVAPESLDVMQERWQRFLNDPSRLSDELLILMQTATGHRLSARLSIWRLPEPDLFLLVHQRFSEIQERLQAVYAIQTAVAGTLELAPLMDTVLREVHRLIPCDTCTIFIRERDNTIRVRRWQQDQIANYRSETREQLPEFVTSQIMRETGRPVIIDDTESDSRWVKLPNHRSIRSWLGAPLTHHGEFMGELNLDSLEPNAFSREDGELAHTLAIQVAAALYNVHQFQDEQRRAERFRALSEVSQAISQLDLRSVLELVYQRVSGLMDTTTFFIGLHDSEAGLVRLVGSYDHGIPRPDEVQRADQGISGLVIRTRQSLIIYDSQRDDVPDEIIVQGEEPRSLLMFPLITQDEVVGVISVQSYVPNAYTADDIEVLEIIAGAVATAVRNAQLYDQALEQMHALEALHQMSLNLAAVQDPDEVAALITQTAFDLFKPGEMRLCLCYDAPWEAKTWISASGDPAPRVLDRMPAAGAAHNAASGAANNTANNGAASHQMLSVCQMDKPLIVAQASDFPDLHLQDEFDTPWPVQAAVIYPVIRTGRHLATLNLLYQQPHFFRQSTLRTLELLSHQAATALENARYTVTLRRRLHEVSALHDLAREISSMESLDDILQTVVDTMHEVYQCKSASIALVDPGGQEVITLASSGLDPHYVEEARFAMGEYVAGEVATTGKVLYVPDTAADPRFRVVDPGIRALMVVPLTVRGRVIGTLGIDSATPHAFSHDHERVLTIAGGQIAAAIETVRLLHETRAHANQLAQANSQLAAQDELRRELIYQVSHDLRGPLQIIYGYVDMMRDEMLGPVTPTQKEILTLVVKRSKAIERMTKDIMAVRPINHESLELSRFNLSELCQQALVDAQMITNDPRFRFVSDMTSQDLAVEADYNRLSRVFDNLLHNAVKFSPEGGTITLRTERDDERRCVRISISDEGIGIAPEKLPYIFERFYRGDKAFRQRFEGTGLGLYNVYQIIQAHQGTVWVESEDGAGSTFIFELPLVETP